MIAWALIITMISHGKITERTTVHVFATCRQCSEIAYEKEQLIAEFYKKNPDAVGKIEMTAKCVPETSI